MTATRRWVKDEGWRYGVVLALLGLAALAGQRTSRRVLGLLIAGVGLVVILGDLRWALLALPALSAFVPFNISTGTAVSLNLTAIALPGLAVLWSAQGVLKRRLDWPSSRLDRPVWAFLFVAFASLLRSIALWDLAVPRPSNMLLVQLGQVAIYVLSYVVFRLTANLITDFKWLRRLAYAFLGVVTLALVFLLSVAGGGVIIPLLSGIWMVALALGLALCDPQLQGWQRGVLVLIGLVAPIGLRSLLLDWVALWAPPIVAGAAVLWLRSSASRWLLAVGLVIVLILVGASGVQGIMDWEREWETSGAARITLWISVIELASSRPLLGLGPAAYRHYHYLKPLAYGRALWLTPNVSAHNQFVDLFAQVGIVGLTCYVWFLVEVARLAFRLYARCEGFARGYALAVLGALAGVLVADMVAASSLPFVYNNSFRGFRGSALHWMMLGGLVVLENLESRQRGCGEAEGA